MQNMLEYFRVVEKRVSTLQKYAAANPPAYTMKTHNCNKCGLCCLRIAEYLNISHKAFFLGYCTPEYIGKPVKDNWFLILRRAHQEGGKFLTWQQTHSIESPCVFYNKKTGCDIYTIKPEVCSLKTLACYASDDDASTNLERTDKWTDNELLALGVKEFPSE